VAEGQAEVLAEEQVEEAADGQVEMHKWIFVYIVIIFNLLGLWNYRGVWFVT
jgi:hypothetical protein